jgi:hypothetical protein
MNRRDEKQRAWDEWHAGYYFHDIPMMSPAFEHGFDSAWDAMLSELRSILTQIEFAQFEPESFGQELDIALSRIRKLTEEPR